MPDMRTPSRLLAGFALMAAAAGLTAQTNTAKNPTWWAKYQYLSAHAPDGSPGPTHSFLVGANVDASNECGPQSETFITLNPAQPGILAGGSNEIFRDYMRGFYSADGGSSWGAVDLPLPPPLPGTNDIRFGSDPTLAFDSKGNLYYGYIVVFFGGGNGVNGSELAVAKSTDGGKTYSSVTYFGFQSGSNHFNDKPMITVDANPKSPYRDTVYLAWDAASGGSTGGGIRLARSTDGGASFSAVRIDDPSGPGRSIGAVPFTGPGGEVYVAWNDYAANAIVLNSSLDGGATWNAPRTVATKSLAFDIAIPAESYRGALVYPVGDTDRSTGTRRGRLYCSWMDLTAAGTTDILLSYSDDKGATWSAPKAVADQLGLPVDRFNHWMSVDPATGDVDLSFYDTRNDTTGFRYMTDIYFTQSRDGGASWRSPNTRVSSVSSNEHDCGPGSCPGIDYGNQQGDYAGLVSYGGVSHPFWVDSRGQLEPAAGCSRGLLMEEVFTATVK